MNDLVKVLYLVAFLTPCHGSTCLGGRNRRVPVGGAANGTERKALTLAPPLAVGSQMPRSAPDEVVTRSGSAAVSEDAASKMASSNMVGV